MRDLIYRLLSQLEMIWNTQRKICVVVLVFAIAFSLAAILWLFIGKSVAPIEQGVTPKELPEEVLTYLQDIPMFANTHVSGYALHQALSTPTEEGTTFVYNLYIVTTPSEHPLTNLQQAYEEYRSYEQVDNHYFLSEGEVWIPFVVEVSYKGEDVVSIRHY